jgi:hypothetical protein
MKQRTVLHSVDTTSPVNKVILFTINSTYFSIYTIAIIWLKHYKYVLKETL